MSEHREVPATAVPFKKTIPRGSCELGIRSAFRPGCANIEPAKTWSEIARELGCTVDQVRRDYVRGMTKLGYSAFLEELHYQFLDLRAESDRHFPTPYARTMRVAVVDVAPHELEGAQ